MEAKLHILADNDSLAGAAADFWLQRAHGSSPFNVALSGGSTPKQMFQHLARTSAGDEMWRHCHCYFGDERCVPPDSEQSNYHMARENLFHPLQLAETCVHRMPAELDDHDAAAAAYAQLLKARLPGDERGFPVFDLVWLGLGEDGHTASLFPGTAALEEKEQAVTAVYVEKLQSWRLSLTYPTLNAARCVVVLAAGEAKAPMVARALAGDASLPITGVQPAGELHFFLDRAAAGALEA